MENENLGQVKALHVGASAPANTNMLWYDTVSKFCRFYNQYTTQWELLSKILFFNLVSEFPSVGEVGVIYISIATGMAYLYNPAVPAYVPFLGTGSTALSAGDTFTESDLLSSVIVTRTGGSAPSIGDTINQAVSGYTADVVLVIGDFMTGDTIFIVENESGSIDVTEEFNWGTGGLADTKDYCYLNMLVIDHSLNSLYVSLTVRDILKKSMKIVDYVYDADILAVDFGAALPAGTYTWYATAKS